MSNPTLDLDARAAVVAECRVHARAIVDCIHAARADGLFPDGLTPELQRALAVNQMLAIEPQPPVEPAPLPEIVQPTPADAAEA